MSQQPPWPKYGPQQPPPPPQNWNAPVPWQPPPNYYQQPQPVVVKNGHHPASATLWVLGILFVVFIVLPTVGIFFFIAFLSVVP